MMNCIYHIKKWFVTKNGPDKNGPAGQILDKTMIRLDQYWPTKYGPARLILVTKSGLA